MSSWSIEPLENGYGLVLTTGKTSRTVFVATRMSDAAEFLSMAEVFQLVKGGTPAEVFAKFIKSRAPRKPR